MKKVTATATSSPRKRRHEFRKKRWKLNSIVADETWEISPLNHGLKLTSKLKRRYRGEEAAAVM
jgi:hypothetical protein